MTKLNPDRFIDPKSLDQFALECLVNAGLREDIAASTAAGLTLASLRGIDSHGIRLLPHYYQELQHGRINPNPDISPRGWPSRCG
jgi:LDH2 family malate/lactate/ureidoglycolate dehydrogenase